MKILASLLLAASLLLSSACSTNKPEQALPDGSAQAANTRVSKQWHCEGDRQQQWHCSDLAQPKNRLTATEKQPIKKVVTKEKRATQATPPISASNTTSPVTQNPPPAQPRSLMDYPENYYAVQLIAAHKQKTINQYLQQHPQLKAQQLSIRRDQQLWHLLILGIYPSRQAAGNAIKAISPPLASSPWIRPLGPLQQSQ